MSSRPQESSDPSPEVPHAEDKLIEAYPLALRRERIQVVPVEEMFAR